MSDDKWTLAANKKEGQDRLYRFEDTNIFKVVRDETEDLFKVNNPDHSIWTKLITIDEASEFPASKKIYNEQMKQYLEIDIEEGYIIVEGNRIDFDSQEVTAEDKAQLVSENI